MFFFEARGNTRLARGLVTLALYASALLLTLTFCSSLMSAQSPAGGSFTGFWVMLVVLLFCDGAVAWYAASQGFGFELLLEKRWRKTCAGLGGSFMSERVRMTFNPTWSIGGSMLKERYQRKFPKLRGVEGTAESWTGLVYAFYGQTVDTYNDQSAAFALAFNVKYCSFERTPTGVLRIRCGPIQVPEKYDYPAEQLARPVMQPSLIETTKQLQTMNLSRLFDARETLKAIPVARTVDGQPYYLPVEGNHILIAGKSGSGKNSWTWSLVFGLTTARQAGLVKLYGLDPKRVELAYGREYWDEYADTVELMVELLEKAVADLNERNKLIQGNARKIEPSQNMPLVVIVIDELAYLSALVPDKKLRDRAQAAIGTILWLGRATGYVLVAATQSVLKEVITYRDDFLTKVALRMPAPMVDLCLGEGMYEAGAHCELIPFKEAGAGCAYVLDEQSSEPFLVRAAWVSDEAIRYLLDMPGDAKEDVWHWPEG